ncbi:MAG: hypothetical protein NZV14_04260 [Bryobacteraceae bacterium]|nr:hypothetical protein [Bryobacteraceae bacterium]MDW8377346.1 hypothetical protein [Bryobacterales bacterium]
MDGHHEEQVALVLGQRQVVAVCLMFLVVIGLVATLSYVTGRSITVAQLRNADETHATPAIIVDPRKSHEESTPLEARAASAMPTAAPVASQKQTLTPPSPPESGREESTVGSGRQRLPALAPSSGPLHPLRPSVSTQPSPNLELGVHAKAVAQPKRTNPVVAPLPSKLAATTNEERRTEASGELLALSTPIGGETVLAEPQAGETFWQVGVVDHRLAESFSKKVAGLGLPVRLAAGQSADGRRVLVGPLRSRGEIETARKLLAAAGYQHFLRKF